MVTTTQQKFQEMEEKLKHPTPGPDSEYVVYRVIPGQNWPGGHPTSHPSYGRSSPTEYVEVMRTKNEAEARQYVARRRGRGHVIYRDGWPHGQRLEKE